MGASEPVTASQSADWHWQYARTLDAVGASKWYVDWIAGHDDLMREMCRRDLYYLLTVVLKRLDMTHPWLYARIREVEVARDWHLDLWAREHRKLLRVDEPVPTPTGWTNHGDLKPGDAVFGPDGMPCRVIAKTQVWERPPECRITFDDGTSIIAGDEHLWEVERKTKKRIPMAYKSPGPKRLYRERAIVSTLDIEAHNHRADNRFAIRVNQPLELPEVELPIDPYILGCWLGDGHSSAAIVTMMDDDAKPLLQALANNGHTATVRITGSKAKEFRIDVRDRSAVCVRGHERTPDNVYRNGCKKCKAQQSRRVKFGDKQDPVIVKGLAWSLRALKLLADPAGVKRGYHKHIPAQYLRASASQRLALLQGLCDTDGSCSVRGTATFWNTNDALIDGVIELANSLGLKPVKRRHLQQYRGNPYNSWGVSFQAYQALPPFRIPRKLERCKDGARPHPRRYIVSCERVEPTPGSCIQVDRPDGLYLAGRAMVTTHNSSIITFGCTIQDILASHGDNPIADWKGIEPSFGIFSHSAGNAQKFLAQIKQEFESNAMLQHLFPDILYKNPERESQKWSNDGIIVKRKGNKRECTVEAWGLDSQPTGAHFEVMIYDDVIDLGGVNTPEMIEKATRQWEMSISLGVTEGGRQRYIGTRYGIMDTYAEIMQRGIVKVRIYPSTDDGTATGKPVLFSPDEHEKRRRSMGPSTFASQWLQAPVSKGTATFDIEHLRFAEIRPKTINVYILCDPAHSKRKGTDKTAIAVIAVDAQANKYLVDGYNHRMNLAERWDALKGLRKTWMNATGVQSVQVFYERYGMQSDLEHFESEMRRDGSAFDIGELAWPREGSGAKGDRIARLYPDFCNSHFFLPSLARDGSAKLCYLKVVAGELKYQPAVAETKLMRQMKVAGQLYRVLRPVLRKDEEGRSYDLSTRFITEFLHHPAAGSSDDLIDAVSRIYDAEARPPLVIDDRDTEPPVFPDS